jgi:hypothetical protein
MATADDSDLVGLALLNASAWQAQDAGEILGIGVGAVHLDHRLHHAVEVLGA